jgi:DNA-binding NarL/FixJ family response regulator
VPRERKISVVLVEDEGLVRASVRKILHGGGFEVVGEAGDAEEGVEVTLRERPDVSLVDVGLPTAGGISVARELTKRAPEIAVVMFSASERHDDLIDAIRAGAVGYLLKDMDPGRLAAALRAVAAGEAAIPRPLMAHLVKELQTQGRRRAVIARGEGIDLTSREWEVLDMLCEELTTAEIAKRLSLSPVTVRRHVSETVRKLGARDRGDAVALVEGRL